MKQSIVTFILCVASLQSLASQALPEDEYDCFVVPYSTANVGSPVRGVVSQMLADRGDTVVKGQPIAVLESGGERILLSQVKAKAEMMSEITARKSDLELSKLALARLEDLHRQGMAPTQQRDEARIGYEVARAGLSQALENQKLIMLELEQASYDLEQRTVKSPMDGVVIEKYLAPGEFIFDEPIMSIATLDPLKVEVVLPAKLFGSIRKHDRALITTELKPDDTLMGRVDVVDALLDTRSGTFGVRLALSNPDLTITAGQRCFVDFNPTVGTLELAEEAG